MDLVNILYYLCDFFCFHITLKMLRLLVVGCKSLTAENIFNSKEVYRGLISLTTSSKIPQKEKVNSVARLRQKT